MMPLMNTEEVILAIILMMKKHQVILQQTLTAEIRFNALNLPIEKDSDGECIPFLTRDQ